MTQLSVYRWHEDKSRCTRADPTRTHGEGITVRGPPTEDHWFICLLFFNRFDTAAPAGCLQPPPLLTPPPPPDSTSSNFLSPSHPSPTPHTSSGSHATCPPLTIDSNSLPTQPASFTPLHVRRQLSKLPTGKPAGPDVSPQVLRARTAL